MWRKHAILVKLGNYWVYASTLRTERMLTIVKKIAIMAIVAIIMDMNGNLISDNGHNGHHDGHYGHYGHV